MTTKQELVSLVSSRLESAEVELPVFDEIALRIDREVRANKLDADLICQILEEDLALIAELLRTANSSFFAGMSQVSSLREAAVRLGVRQIASIVFSVSQKRLYSASGSLFKARFTRLWFHTSAVSMGARWVAANAGFRGLADDAFLAALLHDIGKLSLLTIIEGLIASDDLQLSDEVIDQTLLEMHSVHGAELLRAWNLPEFFQNNVLQHEAESLDESNPVLCITRLVDKVCISEGLGDMDYSEQCEIGELAEVSVLSLSDNDLEELRLVLRDLQGGVRSAA